MRKTPILIAITGAALLLASCGSPDAGDDLLDADNIRTDMVFPARAAEKQVVKAAKPVPLFLPPKNEAMNTKIEPPKVKAICHAPKAKKIAAPNPDKILAAGDRLKVTVFREKDLSGEFRISKDGTISYPLLGELKVSGSNTRDVQDDIKSRLADGYLVKPELRVEIIADCAS